MTDDLSGTVLAGKYRIGPILGTGAMGVVYRAVQLDAEGHALRDVALKIMQPSLSSDEAFVRRFLQEIRTTARLHGAHVVTVYDTGRADGRLYFSMELVDGPTLDLLLAREGALPLERGLAIAIQICEGLEEAHGATPPLIHRDLKPSNIFVTSRNATDFVKIGDFGIAKVVGEATAGLTVTGTSLGTPRYMAPEQWQGRDIDLRADLYAVGMVLYEILAGRTPFPVVSTVEALMYQHLHERPTELSTVIPLQVRREVMRLLAKEPADRHPDAPTLRRSLRAALDEIAEDGALHSTASSSSPEETGERSPRPMSMRDNGGWGPFEKLRSLGSPGVLIMGSLAVLLVLGAALLWLLRSSGRFVVGTLDYVTQNLVNVSGINPNLAKAVVILVTIPFFWAVTKYTGRVYRSPGLRPSLKLYTNIYGIILVGYVAVFFLTLYGASRSNCFGQTTGEALKWYAWTPEGIRFADSPGVDPKYGVTLKPVTPEIVSLIEIPKLRRAESLGE
jgi:serine/threonine protein kinase